MKILYFLLPIFALAALAAPVCAQNTTVTTTTTTTVSGTSASQALAVAKDGVDASLRARVVSIYGTGTPAAIHSWYVIFYDPSVDSHGRAVKVENGQITKAYEAKGGVVYGDTLTFGPAQVTDDAPALAAAQNYATQHAIAYNQVRVLLRLTTKDQGFRWRIQLLNDGASRGFVFVNANDNSFAMYAPPGSQPASSGGSVTGDVQHAANDVKNTFLGIGGDLQEFFTGDRTVDK